VGGNEQNPGGSAHRWTLPGPKRHYIPRDAQRDVSKRAVRSDGEAKEGKSL
jgi:hypothetical protein